LLLGDAELPEVRLPELGALETGVPAHPGEAAVLAAAALADGRGAPLACT
jgi:hypothetical protein